MNLADPAHVVTRRWLHDLAGPLGALRVSVESIKKRCDVALTCPREIALAEAALNRMVEMVRQGLDGEAQEGAATEIVPFDLGTELVAVIALCRHKQAEAGRRVQLIVERRDESLPSPESVDSEHIHVKVSRVALGRVVTNLLENAFQAIPGDSAQGEIRVTYGYRVDSGDGSRRRAYVAVRDTGRGMPAPLQSQVFEDGFTQGQGGGRGYGLAIVKSLVTEWGGEVTVRSEPGHGSEFRVTMPI